MSTDQRTQLSSEDKQPDQLLVFHGSDDEGSKHVRHMRSYAIFFVLEASFIALAWYCYPRPRSLPQYANLLHFQTLKSGVIVIFNFWHRIATAVATEICYESFSREWKARENAKPTDKVSKVTSGAPVLLIYTIKDGPSKTYATALFLLVGLIAMATTGSSAIIATDSVQSPDNLAIGIINTASLAPNSTNMNNLAFRERLSEANMVVRLEQLLNEPWGYVPESNYLIPLPADVLTDTTEVKYESDVVHFHYQCHRQAPDSFVNNTMTIGNETWTGNFKSQPKNNITITNGSTILQLTPNGETDGMSVFLFLSGNSTLPPNSSVPSQTQIDLSGSNAIYNPDGFFTYDDTNRTMGVVSPLAALLVCDPNLQFASGTVDLNPVANLTAPDVTVGQTSPGSSKGIIDPSAARSLFTSVLSYTIGEADLAAPGPLTSNMSLSSIAFLNINDVSAQMFLNIPPSPRDWTTLGNMELLDLEKLNQNLDSYTLSALKAFTSGYDGESATVPVAGTFSKDVDATSTITSPALSTSIRFAILHTVLFVVVAIGLSILTQRNKAENRKPFTLVSLEKYFHSEEYADLKRDNFAT